MSSESSSYGGSDMPRDVRGYGQTPPDPKWPKGAKVALNLVVNYEEGGENCLLHGDTASEGMLSEMVGCPPYEGQRHANMESLYDFGGRAGFWRLHRIISVRNMCCVAYQPERLQ